MSSWVTVEFGLAAGGGEFLGGCGIGLAAGGGEFLGGCGIWAGYG